MKLSTKPISSPGRAEKYPPPLMRFLRTNVGSKSRGRSRSSPMFIRKKHTAIETQEPSSPKVTCMGQVRVNRSKQTKTRPCKPKPSHRRCNWLQSCLLCRRFTTKLKPSISFLPSCTKFVSCFRPGWCCSEKTRAKAKPNSRTEPKFNNRTVESDRESFYEPEPSYREVEPSKVSISTPPRNALILTRSRSAPYRSSSLACRFWGSPISNGEETEQKQEEEKSDHSSPTSKRDSTSDQEQPVLDRENEVKLRLFEGSILKRLQMERDEDGVNNTLRPLILTRCKSEPARTAEKKLDPELSFWRKRRLGFT